MNALITIKKILILSAFFVCSITAAQTKVYNKNYFENGKIESEGWSIDNQKVDYWFFYNENGTKKEEGHFVLDKKTKWWLFYDNNEVLSKKCQFYNDKQEGLAVIYKKGAIIRAEKYKMNIKIKQWETLAEFRKDNLFSSL